MMPLVFRAPTAADAEDLAAIDRAGLATGHASFRADPYPWHHFQATYLGPQSLAIVATLDTQIAGWAGVAPVSDRCVYSGVGEVSVYVSADCQGRGIGRQVLTALIARSEDQGFWTLIAQIFPENTASLALHHACGFKTLGRRERIGKMPYGPMAGQWRDTFMLERRSHIRGCD